MKTDEEENIKTDDAESSIAAQQRSVRNFLRFAGVAALLTGLVCVVIATAELFSSHQPRHFWLAFIGLPLMFVGSVMCMHGFMGAVLRFAARESRPVAAETVNYMAEETKGAIKTVSKSVAEGVIEGLDAARTQQRQPTEGKD